MIVATCQTDSHPQRCPLPFLYLYSGSQSNLLIDLGELTRLKSETLAHPDHIAQLPCILSTHRLANRIGSPENFLAGTVLLCCYRWRITASLCRSKGPGVRKSEVS